MNLLAMYSNLLAYLFRPRALKPPLGSYRWSNEHSRLPHQLTDEEYELLKIRANCRSLADCKRLIDRYPGKSIPEIARIEFRNHRFWSLQKLIYRRLRRIW